MIEPHTSIASVWPTGGQSALTQLVARRYIERSRTDHHLMPPAIAEYAVTTLTRPGDIVLDPDCGAGSTIVEALCAGRHAIGLTDRPRWWRIARARANVTAAKAAGAASDGMVLVLNRRASTGTAAETAGFTGRVALVLTTLRSADTGSGGRLRALLTESRPLLRPGGYVVITTPTLRDPITYELVNGLQQILDAGIAAGVAPIARCVALTADVRRSVKLHPSAERQRAAAQFERATGRLCALPAHHMAVVFRADPDANDAALSMPLPPLPVWRRRTRRAATGHRRPAQPAVGVAA